MPNSSYTTANNTMASGGSGPSGVGLIGSASLPQYVISNTTNNSWSNNITSTGPVIAPDFIMDGVSLKENFDKINERLAILVPDLAKLEKFAALKAAYEHYKLLEKICQDT
mgnify:CR=1 FL=1